MKQKNLNTMQHCNDFRKLLSLFVSIFIFFVAFAQERNVTGLVTDKDDIPLPGVNIIIKGTTNGTLTDVNGKYSIKIPGDNTVLSYSYLGYASQEVQVGNQNNINITLKEELKQVDEVVVVGYGVQKKLLNTGATLNLGGDQIQSLRTNTAMDALKGISPGVSIEQNSGVPGSGTKVNIRGIGTIGNSAPLYVVDGVVVGNIDFLSPSEIESIDVLKDAASSAIYGARAANGVILVTTKEGKMNMPTQVTFDAFTGISKAVNLPQMLNAKQYIQVMDSATIHSNPKSQPINWATYVPDYNRIMSGQWNGTNWLDAIKNSRPTTQNYNLNVVGGSKTTSYSLGGSYYKEEGIFGQWGISTYSKYNLKLNSDYSLFHKNGHDIVSVGEKILYTNTQNPTIRTGNIYWNDVHNMLVASPIYPVYDSTGQYRQVTLNSYNQSDVNPIAVMDYNDRYSYNNNNNIVANGYINIQPIKDLTIRSSYGVNTGYGSSRQWTPQYTLSPKSITLYDKVSQSMYNTTTWTNTNTATYKASLGKNNFTILVGNEMTKTSQGLFINGSNQNSLYQNPQQAYLSNAPIVNSNYTTLAGKDTSGWALMSYFGRISYDYNETYMLTAVLRADGSSMFPQGHRWGTFPSVSGGWLVSNEPFMDAVKAWLNSLKIRASWGQNGNQAIQPFNYLSLISNSGEYYTFGSNQSQQSVGAYPSIVPNFNLTWETSQQTDIGTDLYAFKNRLQFTFDYFDKETKGWLVQPPALTEQGASPAFENGGSISNKGVEFSLKWNDQAGDLKYGVNVDLSYIHNRITQLNSIDSTIHGQANVLSQGTDEMYRAQIGFPIGYFYGYKTNGLFQDTAQIHHYVNAAGKMIQPSAKPGDPVLIDENHDGSITPKDRVMIGDPNPHFILGLQFNTEYKGFYLSASAYGHFGQQIAMSYRSFVDSPWQNYTTDILNSWHGPGTSNTMPRVTLAPSSLITDMYIHNGDFLKISNVTVGYNFKNLMKSLTLFSEVKLYVSVKNLYTFTKYKGMDPEVAYGPDNWSSGIDLGLYPASQTWMAGLSVKF